MTTVCETNLCVFPTDDGTPEPSKVEVEVEIKLKLIDPGRGHAANVDDWGVRLVETKDPGDIFACGYCEGEACERDLGEL